MTLETRAALLLVCAASCGRSAPPRAEEAPPLSLESGGPVQAAVATVLLPPPTTNADIALSNLDVQIRSREASVARDPDDVQTAVQLVAMLLARGQYTGRIVDYEHADALATRCVDRHPTSGEAHLARASTLETFHLFEKALGEVDAAERLRAQAGDVKHARASTYMAQGRFDEADALGLWHETQGLDATELASAGVLAGERERDAESDALFEKARSAYRDVSPFPVAWVDFQRGSLLERKGEPARAKLYFAEAHQVLPTFAHACVHLAALETPGRARDLLEPLRGKSDDPEVDAAYADVLRRLGRMGEAQPIIARVASRYEELLGRHPEAFADHAANFYLGLGGNAARAVQLARLNAANRRTEAALDLWVVTALVAGLPDEACRATTVAASLPYKTAQFQTTLLAARGSCADATVPAGDF